MTASLTKEQRQRRSTIVWEDYLPVGIAGEQRAWERRRTIQMMRDRGMTQKQVAEWFGISLTRIGQLCREQERQLAKRSPAEVWLRKNGADYERLRKTNIPRTHGLIERMAARANPLRPRDWLHV